jgi:hypothetical protein
MNIDTVDLSHLHLWEREQWYIHHLKQERELPEPQYAIAWEDPAYPDDPMRVTVPSKEWLALAMRGGILPPVEVYHELASDEAKKGFRRHTRGYLLHETPPIPAMTEEEAMEYLVKKDTPPRVWRDYKGNRVILKIVPRSLIPTNREHRNAWRINQEAA